jgi:hypothetical protein
MQECSLLRITITLKKSEKQSAQSSATKSFSSKPAPAAAKALAAAPVATKKYAQPKTCHLHAFAPSVSGTVKISSSI